MSSRGWVTGVTCIWLVSCAPPPDMNQGLAVGPHQQPLSPPVGTLAVDAPPILSLQTAWQTLTNPRPATASVTSEGAELFGIYCAICHGSDGAGEGPVSEYFRRVPDLTAPYIRRYPDGRLYTVIRAGRVTMPAYADSLSVDERWAIVHYIRTLGNDR